jgi:hypothetical protein
LDAAFATLFVAEIASRRPARHQHVTGCRDASSAGVAAWQRRDATAAWLSSRDSAASRRARSVFTGMATAPILIAPQNAHELRRVEAEQQDPVFPSQAETEQRVPRPVDQLVDVGIGQRPAFVSDGGRIAAALGQVAVDEPGRHVELRREDVGGNHRGYPQEYRLSLTAVSRNRRRLRPAHIPERNYLTTRAARLATRAQRDSSSPSPMRTSSAGSTCMRAAARRNWNCAAATGGEVQLLNDAVARAPGSPGRRAAAGQGFSRRRSDLPVEAFLPERQVMAGRARHPVRAEVLAVQHALHERRVGSSKKSRRSTTS